MEDIYVKDVEIAPLVDKSGVSVSSGVSTTKNSKITPKDICTYSNGRAEIRHWELIQFLKQEGFYRSKDVNNRYVLYRVIDNVASVVDIGDVSKFIIDNVMHKRTNRGEYKSVYDFHREIFSRKPSTYISNSKIQLLDDIELSILRDTKDTAYFPFINGMVCVTADKITLRDYKKVIPKDKVIFGEKIKKREVGFVSKEEAFSGDFATFCSRAVGDEGFELLCRSMGYMLHTYKDPARARMIFYSDANRGDGMALGRSGKSLCAEVALSQLRSVSVIDGKQFNPNDRFMLDAFDVNCDIVSFQDMRKAFDKTTLYNMITGDFQVNQKHKNTRTIPFEYSPKIIADSNYGISLMGSSDLGRITVIGFDNHYNDTHQPIDEFGRVFFSEWDNQEWNRFYTFMFYCVQMYMKEGIRSYRLSEMMTNNLYTMYPAILIDMIKANIDFLREEHTAEEIWEAIPYWEGDDLSLPKSSRLSTLTTIMVKLGYMKKFRKKSIREGDTTTSIYLHWFEQS